MKWSTSNKKIATVSSAGIVKIKGAGTAKITIKIKVNGEKYTKKFTISSNGKKATATFKCKKGKKHKMTIIINVKKDSITIKVRVSKDTFINI